MKKRIQHSLKSMMLLAIVFFVAQSCSKDDDNGKFLGENKIVLQTTTTQFIKNDGSDQLLIDLLLVTAVEQDINLEFKLENNQIDGTDLIEIENPKITLKAGEKKAQLTLNSKGRRTIEESKEVILNILSNSSQIALEAPFTITVQPMSMVADLTEEQIRLLDIYKTKGLDLYPLIGEIDVEGTAFHPGDGYQESLYEAKTTNIKGKTAITLSEKATEDRPVLKMVYNAMGIESYLYTLFRNLTIDDTEYWNVEGENAPPAPQEIMKLINLTRTSPETFELALDDIAIDLATKEVSFISPWERFEDDEIDIVKFDYHYSAWDRLKKLLDENNPIAVEHSEQGGTVDPAVYLNIDNISEDEYSGNNWKPSTAKLADHSLTFDFIMGHNQASDYLVFSIKYAF